MTKEIEAAEQQQEKARRMFAIRSGLVEALGDEEDFDVMFTALSHTVGTIIFSYIFARDGELTEDNVTDAADKFAAQVEVDAINAMKKMAPEPKIIISQS